LVPCPFFDLFNASCWRHQRTLAGAARSSHGKASSTLCFGGT
jgi:hypothetical protein